MRTDRLLLRPIEPEDIGDIYRGLSHPDVIKYYAVSFNSLEATQEQMGWYAQPEQCWWAICSADENEFYGAGGLNDISLDHKKAEIGLWLLPECWGRGIMTEAMPLITDHGFNELGLHRIEGFVESGNEGCRRAMTKQNFNHEGTMVDCEVKDGAFISVDIYACINNINSSSLI